MDIQAVSAVRWPGGRRGRPLSGQPSPRRDRPESHGRAAGSGRPQIPVPRLPAECAGARTARGDPRRVKLPTLSSSAEAPRSTQSPSDLSAQNLRPHVTASPAQAPWGSRLMQRHAPGRGDARACAVARPRGGRKEARGAGRAREARGSQDGRRGPMTSHNGRPPRVVEPVCSARVAPEAGAREERKGRGTSCPRRPDPSGAVAPSPPSR